MNLTYGSSLAWGLRSGLSSRVSTRCGIFGSVVLGIADAGMAGGDFAGLVSMLDWSTGTLGGSGVFWSLIGQRLAILRSLVGQSQ